MTYSEFKKLSAGSEFIHRHGKITHDQADIELYRRKGSHILFARDHRTQLIDGYYRVKPIAVYDSQVLIVCPLCGLIHYHGAGKDGKNYEGFRLCHCISSQYRDQHHDSYEIIRA